MVNEKLIKIKIQSMPQRCQYTRPLKYSKYFILIYYIESQKAMAVPDTYIHKILIVDEKEVHKKYCLKLNILAKKLTILFHDIF